MVTAGDSPVESYADDVLGRAALARTVADEIRSVDASRGYVVALAGPWGSGKTSLLNLIRLSLAEDPAYPVLDFNPWLFSGTDQLVAAFFRELSAQLRDRGGERLSTIAGAMETYARYLSPLTALPYVGTVLKTAKDVAAALRDLGEDRRGSVVQQRDELIRLLRDLDRPLVVVVDDIDRLGRDELRDVFKLVRLTASFPNVVYVLAFDRERVEQALSESGPDGRAYLEKIVQLVVDIPAVPAEQMWRQVNATLNAALGDVEGLDLDLDRWGEALTLVVLPLVRTMRDVARYAASVRPTVRALRGDVDLVDALTLEAVRLFLPDVYRAVVAAHLALTTPLAPDTAAEVTNRARDLVDAVLRAEGRHRDVVRTAVTRLFPAAHPHLGLTSSTDAPLAWLRARRVAHIDVLRRYLEHASNERFATFVDAERAVGLLDDAPALAYYLGAIEPARLQYVVAELEPFLADAPEAAVVPTATVLLDLLPAMPDPEGPWYVPPRVTVGQAVILLLRRLRPADAARAVREIDAAVRPLSSRLLLLRIGEAAEGLGDLLDDDTQRLLRERLAADVAGAPPAVLREERDPHDLVLALRAWGLPAPHLPADDPGLNAAMLRSALTEVLVGTGADARTEPRLRWAGLVAAYGHQDDVERAVESVRAAARTDPELGRAVALADRYLDGWQPADPG